MYKQLFLLLLVLITGNICAQTATRIPIGQNIEEKKELKLSEIAKEVKFVALETNENCFLDKDISKIEVFDGQIFISDYSYIFRFDETGKFLNKIGKIGKGPGEYTKGMATFLIDRQNKELIFFEMITKKMMVYDFEGNFIREKGIEFMPGLTEWVDNENMAVYNMGFTYESEPWKDLYMLNRDAKVIKKNKFKKQADKRYGLMIYPPLFYRYNEKTRYKNPHENIIYEVGIDNKPAPVYYLDYGKYEKYNDIDDAEIKVRNGVGTNIPNPKSREKIGLLGLSECDDFLFIYYGHKEERKVGVFDKQAKTFSQLIDKESGLFGLHDDLFGGLPVFPKSGITDDTLYMHYHAWEVKSYLDGNSKIKPELKEVVDSLDENDNPVLIFVKLE